MKIPNSLRWKATGNSLGQGGQAQVYEVLDTRNEFEGSYALKALRRDAPKALTRFHHEVAAIKALDHPYIVKIIDHSMPGDEFPFYVMPRESNCVPLKSLLSTTKNPFLGDALNALRFFERLADVIATCDAKGIVHRDLSPSNLLIRPDQSFVVIDFGLCQIEEGTAVTLVDEGIGTQYYMAPECESGAAGNISSRSDVYSAGKLLWSAVTGLGAFAREEAAFTTKSMKEIYPDHPETWHLHHIFERTIRRNPDDRWPASTLVNRAKRLGDIIRRGHLPLEILAGALCPVCALGELRRFDQSHTVFANGMPSEFAPLQCDECGYCCVINRVHQGKRLASRQQLR